MRILIIGVRRPPETFLLRKFAGLIASGFEVVAATTDRSPIRCDLGIRWVTIPKTDGLRGRVATFASAVSSALRHPTSFVSGQRAAGGKAGVRAAASALAGIHADVIHFEWNLAAVEYLPLFSWLNAPIVISCRGSQVLVAPHNPERKSATAGIATSFSHAAAVHCVSESVKNEAIKLGLDPDKAIVIRPAVDPVFFCPRSRPASDTYRIITTGSLGWVKGPEYGLLALRRLKDAGMRVHLTWIGTGSKHDRQRFLYTMHDLGVSDIVTLAGQMPPDKVRDELHAADVFLLPSVSEGISNAALEAMACGLPVVSTNAGGMEEAIEDGVQGFVVNIRDAAAMAQALTVLSDPTIRARMGTAARRRVENEFNLNGQCRMWAELYREIGDSSAAGISKRHLLQRDQTTEVCN